MSIRAAESRLNERGTVGLSPFCKITGGVRAAALVIPGKPISKPAGARTIRTSKALVAALAIALVALPGCRAQTLARPGWAGSGIAPQPWFRRAVFYRIDARTFQDSNGDGAGDLKGIAQRLDYLRSLGVDAILLAPLTAPQSAVQGGQPNPIDPALGTLDDFDNLSLAASRLGIRVLLDLPAPDPALARFWLTRGVAGFHVPPQTPAGQPNAAAIEAIRRLLPAFVGQRVLITDTPGPGGAPNPAKLGANELVLDTALLNLPAPAAGTETTAAQSTLAGELRAALNGAQTLAQTLARPGALLLATGTPPSVDRVAGGSSIPRGLAPDNGQNLGRILTTILMLSRSGVLLSAGQELALPSATGAPAAMPWGAPPPATEPAPSAAEQPAAARSPAPRQPPPSTVPSDVYVPYVAPKPAAKPPSAPPPDPASVAGQQLDPASPLSFYLQLNQLRHGGTALRDGDQTFLDFDAQNALVWIRKPASPTYANPPVIVLCNLSDKPLAIDLKPEVQRLHLRGSFLKTVLRSDGGMGAMDLSPVRIPPYGVYIGELKF